MSEDSEQQGGLKRLAHRIMPGLELFGRYERSWLSSDLAAGLSVAAIALPVGIAYADLAGVPAVVGMYSAIFPLFLYALFGSSRQLMVGPDAATCIIVAASLGPLAGGDPQKYLAMVVVLTLITGILYVIAGISRLGFIASFLSTPILTGYLNGIALIIMAGQLRKLFGYAGDAGEFFPQLIEFGHKLTESHLPTLFLAAVLLVLLVVLRRVLPKVPGAFVVVVLGIVAVAALGLQDQGVAILGTVPSGLPTLHFALFDLATYETLLRDGAGIVLISFTSGVLTAKSFARRNRYDIDANQELIAFGACNVATGLAQGFPVTGADSRTAVNNAMGGKTQLVGIVAGITMLAILFLLTEPLGYVPTAALAAVVMVSAVGLFDLGALRELYAMSRRELLLSLGTTLGVLVLGVLPGVLLAVVLSLLWLLATAARPHDTVLGSVPGVKGFHSVADYPDATTIPGLLLFRFEGDVVFFNADLFMTRVRAAIAASETPVEWLVIDGSPVNVVDVTAAQKILELREELTDRGIRVLLVGWRQNLNRFFNREWITATRELHSADHMPTLRAAVKAFKRRPRAEPVPAADPPQA